MARSESEDPESIAAHLVVFAPGSHSGKDDGAERIRQTGDGEWMVLSDRREVVVAGFRP